MDKLKLAHTLHSLYDKTMLLLKIKTIENDRVVQPPEAWLNLASAGTGDL
ncbi:hypothetical protein [Heliobacterium mobile]|nr:hypothetical protein [Heliobacterium mobile]